MRLDLFMKKTRMVKQRTLAKRLCEQSRVFVNGHTAKASHMVAPGEHLLVEFDDRRVEWEVLSVPTGNVARREVDEYVRLLKEERIDIREGW